MTLRDLTARLQAVLEESPELADYPVAFSTVDQQRWWDHQLVRHVIRVDKNPDSTKIGVVPHILLTSRERQ
jgi:hypothetical protein